MQACVLTQERASFRAQPSWAVAKAGKEWVIHSRVCTPKQGKHDGLAIKSYPAGWNAKKTEKSQISEAYHRLTSLLSEFQSSHRDGLEAEFQALVTQWRKETGMFSMVHKKAMHPAYQRIIGMGKDVLPLIFRELQEHGGHWIWALRSITGVDAALPDHNFTQAREAWVEWGRQHGYI